MVKAPTCRVTLSTYTKKRLWSESGGYCQNPSCADYLFPDDVDVDFAEMAHVIPASPGGPRPVPLDHKSLRERAHHNNIVVLCVKCHTIADKAPTVYHEDMLLEWKKHRIELQRTALGTPRFEFRAAARSRIEPLLAANRVVHSQYGPTGDPYMEGNPALWRRHARSTVVPNNSEILRVLNANRHLLTNEEKQTVALYSLHVEQFVNRHVLGDWTAGTQRFPSQMEHVLKDEPAREGRTWSDARKWVASKLKEDGYTTMNVGAGGLLIRRAPLPDARVLCIGLGDDETFGPDDVDAAIEAMPDLQFIAVVPTRIGHGAYQRAEERNICVAGFGKLKSALCNDHNVAAHVHSQEQYERDRLRRHSAVASLKHLGHHAYEIQRRDLRPLTIVTTNSYEFTADELYNLLESYEGIDPEIIVVTNPNCQGLSTDSQRAAEQTGVSLVLLQDLLNDLGRAWT